MKCYQIGKLGVFRIRAKNIGEIRNKMGRLKRTEKQIPTLNLRNKAWTRAVFRKLFPDVEKIGPKGHLINAELITANKKVEPLHFKNTNEAALGANNGVQFVSAGRWHDWWTGKTHPSQTKIIVIERIFPGTTDWFSKQGELNMQNKVITLLHAVDLWKGELNQEQQVAALKLLTVLGKQWNPVVVKEFKADGSLFVLGWKFLCVPDGLPIAFKRRDLSQHYRTLEPSTVTHLMLICAEYHCEYLNIEDWVFHLVTSTLATKALLRHYEHDGADCLTSGPSADIAAFVSDIFVKDRVGLVDRDEIDSVDVIRRRIRLCGCDLLPDTYKFAEYLFRAVVAYENELSKYGIGQDEFAKLDFN